MFILDVDFIQILFVLSLQARLAQSNDSMKALLRRQLDLEQDIEIKSNTLFIDETECMGMRKSISIQTYWGSH